MEPQSGTILTSNSSIATAPSPHRESYQYPTQTFYKIAPTFVKQWINRSFDFYNEQKKNFTVIGFIDDKVRFVFEPVFEKFLPTLEKIDSFGAGQLDFTKKVIVDPLIRIFDFSKQSVKSIATPMAESVCFNTQTVCSKVLSPTVLIISQTIETIWSLMKLPILLTFAIAEYFLDKISPDSRVHQPELKTVYAENLIERLQFLLDKTISKIKSIGYRTEDQIVTIGGIFMDRKKLQTYMDKFNRMLAYPCQQSACAFTQTKRSTERARELGHKLQAITKRTTDKSSEVDDRYLLGSMQSIITWTYDTVMIWTYRTIDFVSKVWGIVTFPIRFMTIPYVERVTKETKESIKESTETTGAEIHQTGAEMQQPVKSYADAVVSGAIGLAKKQPEPTMPAESKKALPAPTVPTESIEAPPEPAVPTVSTKALPAPETVIIATGGAEPMKHRDNK